jgi:hypothetical protein
MTVVYEHPSEAFRGGSATVFGSVVSLARKTHPKRGATSAFQRVVLQKLPGDCSATRSVPFSHVPRLARRSGPFSGRDRVVLQLSAGQDRDFEHPGCRRIDAPPRGVSGLPAQGLQAFMAWERLPSRESVVEFRQTKAGRTTPSLQRTPGLAS